MWLSNPVSEVIDLWNPSHVCNNLTSYPETMKEATGGLVLDQFGNDAILVCGGDGSNGISDNCYSLGESAEARLVTQMTTPRTGAASLVINNGSTLWVTGGWSGLERLDSTEFITLESIEKIHDERSLPMKLSHHCLVRINVSHVMIIGGHGIQPEAEQGSWYLSGMDVMDSNSPWIPGPSLIGSNGLGNHVCGVIVDAVLEKTFVLVAGGSKNSYTGTFRVQYLGLDSDAWTLQESALNRVTSAASSIVSPDLSSFIIIGGFFEPTKEPFYQTLSRCQMIGGSCHCQIMEQELQTPRAFAVAILIPQSFTTCF